MLKFAVIPWNFKTDPVMFAKASAFNDEEWNSMMNKLGKDSRIVLSTCNRSEVYFSIEEREIDSIRAKFPEILVDDDALKHVFRVAAGLESMSIGENEILGQLSEAFEKSLEQNRSNKFLSLILRKAISTGKLVRKETKISSGKTSISAIAVERASKKANISDSAISIIGTGRMAEQFLKYLLKYKPANISLIGRNADRLLHLSQQYGAVPHCFDEMPSIISSSDVIFVATSSKKIIVRKSSIDPAIRKRQIFIDISHPRNVETGIAGIPGREIVNLDDITREVSKNLAKKESEIASAEKIIDESIENLKAKIKEMQIEDLIEKSYNYMERIAKREVDRMIIELKKGNDIDSVKSAMIKSMIDKMLSQFIRILKKAADKDDSETLEKLEMAFSIQGL